MEDCYCRALNGMWCVLSKYVLVCLQAINAPQEEAPPADEAKAAKRRRLPPGPAQHTETPTNIINPPSCPLLAALVDAPAATRSSISSPPTSQPLSPPGMYPLGSPDPTSGVHVDAETPMDMSAILREALTESSLASDPTLTPQTTPFQSTLNSDPLLSAPSPPPPPQHMSDSYTPSSSYVSYMETLLHSHFPQDDGTGPLY